MWSITTDGPMVTEEAFLWRRNVSTHQCDLIPVKSNTLASNLDVINLISLLLSDYIDLITMLTPHDLLPTNSNKMEFNLDGINPIFIFELMEFPYVLVHITSSSTCIYTPILQILCAVIFYYYYHIYYYTN